MHKIDTTGHVANQFSEGDPGVPRLPTEVDEDILNAFQTEIVTPIESSGQTLLKGTNNQLAKAIGFNGGSGGARVITGKLTLTEPASGSIADPLLAVNARDASGTKAATMQGAPTGAQGVLEITHNGSASGSALKLNNATAGGAGPALNVESGRVKVSAANPSSSAGHSNELSALGLEKGWAHFAWSNGAPTLASGMNMAAPGNPGAGQIQVNLTTAIGSGAVVVTGNAGPGSYVVVPKNLTGLIEIQDLTGTPVPFGSTTGFAFVRVAGRQ